MTKGIVRIESNKIASILSEFSQIGGKVPLALSRALNRAVGSAHSEAVRQVRDQYTVKASSIRKTTKVTRATPDRLEAAVTSVGSSIPLGDFKTSPSSPNPRRRAPISVEVRRGQSKSMGSAFLARVGSNVGVFHRVGKARLPIEKMYGPSVPSMMNNENVTKAVVERAEQQLDSRIGHELNRILGVK